MEINGRDLTQAGHDALRLPVRNLVDLWQAARKRCCAQRELEVAFAEHMELRDPQRKDMEQPIELVTEMLRRSAFESNLPDWACGYLSNRVIYRNELGQPCLDFRDNPLRWRLGISVKDRIDVRSASPDGESPLLMSTLVLHDSYGYTAQLHDPEEPSRSVEIEPAALRRMAPQSCVTIEA